MMQAKELLRLHPAIRARDAIHAAVMKNREMVEIVSYDRHFDLIPGISRREP